MQEKKLTFIGAGNITNAIISGLISNGYLSKYITVCAPTDKNIKKLVQKYNIIGMHDNYKGCKSADVIIFAVKPHHVHDVCSLLNTHNFDFKEKIILSIVAGITINNYKNFFHVNKLKIIRGMTNICSAVCYGVSALFTEASISIEEKKFLTSLMKTFGKVFWMHNESEINKLLALTSSAPAYYFLLMELMQHEAEKLGFDIDIAKELILHTAYGSMLLALKSKQSFASLRQSVTSPNGTTAKALDKFHEGNITQTIRNVIYAALMRAEEIEKQF
uniref:Pyrroline-5-carboxylate reductase n=1 Tax=Candidatus Aschnera chinzeii TaxID=1485666 RepID=A0AAT9G425_9ENTR|nr:MAG: pyrroline-5-carboxylate reductase [Candidatus Aschnera chinzeii]